MSLELHRHKFTFTPADAVLVVGFFVVGPLGLAAVFVGVGAAGTSIAFGIRGGIDVRARAYRVRQGIERA